EKPDNEEIVSLVGCLHVVTGVIVNDPHTAVPIWLFGMKRPAERNNDRIDFNHIHTLHTMTKRGSRLVSGSPADNQHRARVHYLISASINVYMCLCQMPQAFGIRVTVFQPLGRKVIHDLMSVVIRE